MSISYDFSGKVALITGSSDGIGADIAILFAKSGAQVVVTGRNAQRVQSVAKRCSDASPHSLKALQVVADVTKETDLKRLVATTVATFGQLDILVNNAGIVLSANIASDDYIDSYRRVMDTNVNAMAFLTHICVEHLMKTNGNVVNISSICGFRSSSSGSPYCMSKAAMNMFTKCIAVDLGSKGVRVNAVNPGWIRTDILASNGYSTQMSDNVFESMARVYPVGRCGSGADIASAVLYLASDQAAFVTGTCLLADGGHIAANIPIDFSKG